MPVNPTTAMKAPPFQLQLISAVKLFSRQATTKGRQRKGEHVCHYICLAVAFLLKMFTVETSYSYESAASVVRSTMARGEGGRSILITRVRKYLETWDKVLYIFCPTGDRNVK